MLIFRPPPSFETTKLLKHDHTPQRAAVLGTLSYLRDYHIYTCKKDVFHYFNIPKRTGYRLLIKNESHRLHNHPKSGPDPRGRKRKLTREDLQKIEDILMNGFEWRVLNWRQLATAAGISGISNHTIQWHM